MVSVDRNLDPAATAGGCFYQLWDVRHLGRVDCLRCAESGCFLESLLDNVDCDDVAPERAGDVDGREADTTAVHRDPVTR